jgi:hypothetical protein
MLTLNADMLSASQIEAADTIRRLFLDAGFSEYVAAAAIVNAFRESSLNPKSESKSGRYVGLFMLSPDIIASKRARKQADLNTLAIIQEALDAKNFMAVSDSDDLWTLVDAFVNYVERPRERDLEVSQRILDSLELYPEEKASAPAPLAPAAEVETDRWAWGWALGGLLLAAWAYRKWKED